ncbi:hypothetical protein V9Z67_04505 [Streptococcus suis]|uniref:hypothetical protein n=1 Tax=Streptococcus suis TaxID=1307 RepID=UPI00300FE120
MEAQSLVSHQHSWWFSCFSLREKLARSHNQSLRPSAEAFFYHIAYYRFRFLITTTPYAK